MVLIEYTLSFSIVDILILHNSIPTLRNWNAIPPAREAVNLRDDQEEVE